MLRFGAWTRLSLRSGFRDAWPWKVGRERCSEEGFIRGRAVGGSSLVMVVAKTLGIGALGDGKEKLDMDR
jgi:hypothetical protein